MSEDRHPLPPALAAGIATADALIRAARRNLEAGKATDLSQLDALVRGVCDQARDPKISETDRAPMLVALDRLLKDLNELEWQVEAARAEAIRKERDRGA